MRLIAIFAILMLTGCKTVAPKVVEKIVFVDRPVPTYVSIDSALTAPVKVRPAGKPSEMDEVARDRKEAAEQCNRQLKAISRIQGAAKP